MPFKPRPFLTEDGSLLHPEAASDRLSLFVGGRPHRLNVN
jgi:hypothetical protein